MSFWGIVALACGALAIFSANVSAVVPDHVLAGLHASRLGNADLGALREQIGLLEDQTLELERENAELTSRFDLAGLDTDDALRRIGALELLIPELTEAIAAVRESDVDRSSVTASIGEGETLSYDADGGSVSITHIPWLAGEDATSQPMPEPLADIGEGLAAEDGYGIALGPAIRTAEADAAWLDLSTKLGPLLFGLTPLLADEAESGQKRLVVGPLGDLSEATALCTRLEQIGMTCLPVPYAGAPLAN